MKKILFLFAIALVFSCKKADPVCYSCRTVSVSRVGNTTIRNSDVTTEKCDLSADELQKYISDRSYVRSANENNPPYGTVLVTTTSTCTCTRE